MRIVNKIIGNQTYRIEYQDYYSFLYDNNYIKISVSDESFSSRYSVGAIVTVTNQKGISKSLRYVSEVSTLYFDLSQVFIELYSEYVFTVKINLLKDGVNIGDHLFTTYITRGKSLPFKSHNSERVLYFNDEEDLTNFEIFSYNRGTLNIDNNLISINGGINILDLTSYITKDKEYSACFSLNSIGQNTTEIDNITTTNNSAIITLKSSNYNKIGNKGGDLWNNTEYYSNNSYCYTLNKRSSCQDFDIVKIKYRNVDGCFRTIVGKLIEENNEAELNNYYYSVDSKYKSISSKFITKSKSIIKVGFNDISKFSSFGDMIFSDILYFKNYNNDWIPCSLLTESITTNRLSECNDFELEFEILA